MASIEGCDFAGIFVVDHGVITTPADTDLKTFVDTGETPDTGLPHLAAPTHRS